MRMRFRKQLTANEFCLQNIQFESDDEAANEPTEHGAIERDGMRTRQNVDLFEQVVAVACVCVCCLPLLCGLLSVNSPPFQSTKTTKCQDDVLFSAAESRFIMHLLWPMANKLHVEGEINKANRLVLQPWPKFSSSSDDIHDLEFNVHVQHSRAQPD